ncbi:hypothetical protein FACS1894137_18410 [Spirochaetia bacterium]|nr:hypothetical protein FACS1894137_18410 [Spirochaetia bacterium]
MENCKRIYRQVIPFNVRQYISIVIILVKSRFSNSEVFNNIKTANVQRMKVIAFLKRQLRFNKDAEKICKHNYLFFCHMILYLSTTLMISEFIQMKNLI